MIRLYYRALRRTVRELHKAQAEAEEYKARALFLEKKLEERSDLFIEREFKLIDRFLTSNVKTYAIADEIKAASKITDADVSEAEWDAFKADKIDFLEGCAREAGESNPRQRAVIDFERAEGIYKQEFDAERI